MTITTASSAWAASPPAVRVPHRKLPAAVRAAADTHRLNLCPESVVSVVHRADIDGDGDHDYFQDYGDGAGCIFSYPYIMVWWNRSGRFVGEERVVAVLHRNRKGYAFFQWRCSDQDLWHDFRIDYFDGHGERRTACIRKARYEAVKAKYGFAFVDD